MRKRKIFSHKDPPNLKRFRADIEKLSDASGGHHHDHGGVSPNKKKTGKSKFEKSRKQKRKEARQMKKKRKLAYCQRKSLPTAAEMALDKKTKETMDSKTKEAERKQKVVDKRKKMKIRKKEKEKQEEEARKRAAKEEIKKEEKMIKQLEKQLKMNKRKSKSLPKAFMDDGLDYILDAIDESKLKTFGDGGSDSEGDSGSEKVHSTLSGSLEENSDTGDSDDMGDDPDLGDVEQEEVLKTDDSDSDEQLEEKVETDHSQQPIKSRTDILTKPEISLSKTSLPVKVIQKSILRTSTKKTKKVELPSSEKKAVRWGDESLASASDSSSDSLEDEKDNSKEVEPGGDKPVLKEDIYGRLRDKEGNIVKDPSVSGTYVPPGKRLLMAGVDEKKKLMLERLKKQIKGLVNRASESNMQPITTQIEALYQSNSRADVNETMVAVLLDACVSPSLTPERLVMELMMMVAILHSNVGTEVGAVLVQSLAQKFNELFQQAGNYGTGKEMDNIIMLLCQLYNFKVIHSLLVVDIMKKFVECFQEKDIELLLSMLKNVGFSLRKDDPAMLKEIIVLIQSKAGTTELATKDGQSRVRFMLEILLAVKNNNLRKIPQFDADHLEHLKKLTRNFIRGTSLGEEQLRISLVDLLNAENKGRWWVIGSAWEGRQDAISDVTTPSKGGRSGEVSEKILDLAKKQRMNTDHRKNIFCIIMTSEDFVDAFEKLLHLGLKPQQEREIIHVIMNCCLQEKSFNLFYGYLTQKFCEYDRRFQMTCQCGLWDKFKEMSNLSEQNRANLAQLVTHLLVTKALSLSVFKVVEFGMLEKPMVRFLKQTLTGLLNNQESVVEAVFSRIAPLNRLHQLQEGLKLFMQHFLLHKKSKDAVTDPVLVERIALAQKILSSGQTKILL